MIESGPANSLGCLSFGCIKTEAKSRLEDRLMIIRQDLLELISVHKPTVAAVEKLFFNTNVTTAMAVSHARGVILLTLVEQGIAIHEFTPLQVKSRLTGYGMATKQQIQRMVQRTLNLQTLPRPDDAADGLALGICCHMSRQRWRK